jgi:hypothetical protein
VAAGASPAPSASATALPLCLHACWTCVVIPFDFT